MFFKGQAVSQAPGVEQGGQKLNTAQVVDYLSFGLQLTRAHQAVLAGINEAEHIFKHMRSIGLGEVHHRVIVRSVCADVDLAVQGFEADEFHVMCGLTGFQKVFLKNPFTDAAFPVNKIEYKESKKYKLKKIQIKKCEPLKAIHFMALRSPEFHGDSTGFECNGFCNLAVLELIVAQ